MESLGILLTLIPLFLLIFALLKVKQHFRRKKFEQLSPEEKRQHKEKSDKDFKNTMIVFLPMAIFISLKKEVGTELALFISISLGSIMAFLFRKKE